MSDKSTNALSGGNNHHRPMYHSAATKTDRPNTTLASRQATANTFPPSRTLLGAPQLTTSQGKETPLGLKPMMGSKIPLCSQHTLLQCLETTPGSQFWPTPAIIQSPTLPPPHYMSYSTPMSYIPTTSYQHSGPVYTGQPHYPYSAAPQSHLAPMGQPGPHTNTIRQCRYTPCPLLNICSLLVTPSQPIGQSRQMSLIH
ncbi:uncharacterized protein PGTG_08112 [Puccinia graminis f. sp. tritici CRL 75-36-700-3]|uniref:Uncharacterized protein n=1 Tax=Puccinia graminis f. sp. tritici (strain CRL 75-36-700-3 / race SCCL) TaxID=418459 RepID=E3KCA9_PUCGT|nr:uncharacterized protein PGTG_08112 [Puccinia graminis f. sp. tritici CRL 75-36-700-3]EFP81863.2 hypothetical protein PGTG_08112 [Puccinia graminis f. sp. tritici CRL 75-36-700-3]